jgi:hypothetical protein
MTRIFITRASSGIGGAAHKIVDKQVDSLRTVKAPSARFDFPTPATALCKL